MSFNLAQAARTHYGRLRATTQFRQSPARAPQALLAMAQRPPPLLSPTLPEQRLTQTATSISRILSDIESGASTRPPESFPRLPATEQTPIPATEARLRPPHYTLSQLPSMPRGISTLSTGLPMFAVSIIPRTSSRQSRGTRIRP